MRCDCCPFGIDDDTCPEAEGKYGIEHKDGVLGCKHPRNWVEKRDREYTDYLGDMGTDMGIEMDLSENELKRAIELIRIEYANALKFKHIKNPLAYSLYQVWKIADKSKEQ